MQGAPEAISGSGGSHLKRALFNLRICIGGISCIADGWGGGGGGFRDRFNPCPSAKRQKLDEELSQTSCDESVSDESY